jgi:hypothetical protein
MADDHTYRADVPPSPAPTAYYIHAEADGRRLEATPFVYFVSSDHVGDLDRHGDLLDVFDVVRMTRHLAWAEPLPFADQLDLDGDGRFTSEDLDRAVTAILKKARPTISAPAHVRVETTPAAATLVLGDESTMSVPRPWSGRITDVQFEGARADALLHTSVPFAILASTPHATSGCATAADIQVNAPFYRSELQQSRRYTALALDNIRRDPGAYLVSVAYRTLRVFFIEGSSDPHTAQQFEGGGRVYQIAYIASVGLFVLFAAGVWAAWRRGAAIALPLVLIAYIPATLAFVLTNMRYSLTVQPLMFVFVASTLVVAVDALRGRNERGRGRYSQPRSQ